MVADTCWWLWSRLSSSVALVYRQSHLPPSSPSEGLWLEHWVTWVFTVPLSIYLNLVPIIIWRRLQPTYFVQENPFIMAGWRLSFWWRMGMMVAPAIWVESGGEKRMAETPPIYRHSVQAFHLWTIPALTIWHLSSNSNVWIDQDVVLTRDRTKYFQGIPIRSMVSHRF